MPPRDAGRVPASTAQTITVLPIEILSEIIGLVAKDGIKTPDVENTLRSCRARA
jgi:hypothetical protein